MREHLTKLQDYDREKGRQRRNQEDCEKFFQERERLAVQVQSAQEAISKRQVSIRHRGSQRKIRFRSS